MTTTGPTYILGISAFYHDSAAALLCDGKIIAAAQEERFSRIRHDSTFPHNAINWCLKQAGLTLNDVTFVTFYDKPLLKFSRVMETYKALAPRGLESFLSTTTGWLNEKLFQKRLLVKELSRHSTSFPVSKLLFAQHHLSHAASAFYPSPFHNAVVLVLDGIGEWATTTVSIGSPKGLEIVREISFPHSLGLLFSAFTAYIGHRLNGDEYKLMGLAAYGKPVYADVIRRNLIHVKPDGSFRLNMDYFDATGGEAVTNARFNKLFGGAPNPKGSTPSQREMDIAASIQLVTEDIIERMVTNLATEYPEISNLCLAGEVALNYMVNTKLLHNKLGFKNIWIQPAADDSGGAIGAALCAWHQHLGQPLPPIPDHGDHMSGAYLGPRYTTKQVAGVFDRIGAIYRPIKKEDELLMRTVDALAEGKVIGWFQGPMEFGERALGGRSILGDPRNPKTQANMGLKLRSRQSYRPFAASVARENVSQWYSTEIDSPYMLFTAPIRTALRKRISPRQQALTGIEQLDIVRSEIPAVTHADYTSRLHTVHAETNRRFHALLKEFQHKTGCPVLANTAFATKSQPLVNTPEEAFRVFMSTDIDILVIEDHILYKEEQNPALFDAYKTHLTRP
ncbi:MAG: hypothetical protein EON60_02650 [Alphaproteobacteria bacterium]|nr:MAG: hypothetical protein EON60_02650 [Alphaproteobacteria bacterium]